MIEFKTKVDSQAFYLRSGSAPAPADLLLAMSVDAFNLKGSLVRLCAGRAEGKK